MTPSLSIQTLLPPFQEYFQTRAEIDRAVLFGSWAKGQGGMDSDLDIAIHFSPEKSPAPGEPGPLFFEGEDEIWGDLERIAGRQIDLLVLYRAAATVADSALRGIRLVIKDRNIHLNRLLRTSSEAADFREWAEDYWRWKEKMPHVASSRA
jgi:predicted nucleotidyltransferase